MTNHVYRVTEIVGTSPDGLDAAIRNGLDRAAKTLRNIDWFEVASMRGHVEEGRFITSGDDQSRLPPRRLSSAQAGLVRSLDVRRMHESDRIARAPDRERRGRRKSDP